MVDARPDFFNHFNYNTYTSLALPRTWQLQEDSGFPAFFVGIPEAGYTPNLAINVFQFALDITPTDLYQQVAQSASSYDKPGYTETALVEIVIDGCPAVSRVVRWSDSESEMLAVQRQIFVQVAAYVYCFLFTLNGALEAKYAPLCDEIMRSVRFIPIGALVNKTVFRATTDVENEVE